MVPGLHHRLVAARGVADRQLLGNHGAERAVAQPLHERCVDAGALERARVQQGFTLANHRAETRHHVKLATNREGKITSLVHEGEVISCRADSYKVGGTSVTARMYAIPNIATKVIIQHADRDTPGFMRAPPEVPYMFAQESAMDELAYALDMDPVELRRINDAQTEPVACPIRAGL